tara:strand:+ start:1058 stop:1300 length:243 start_codon:yes stop_codon:yes gene_type:complete
MTPKEFLQKKYPQMRGDKWDSNEIINDNWIAQMMKEYKDLRVIEELQKLLEKQVEIEGVYMDYTAINDFELEDRIKELKQ